MCFFFIISEAMFEIWIIKKCFYYSDERRVFGATNCTPLHGNVHEVVFVKYMLLLVLYFVFQ